MRRIAPILAALFAVCAAVQAQPSLYVGAKKCRPCHLKQYNSWAATKMANAFDLLKPGVRSDAKKRAKQDPSRDYTHDANCLPCHTTGYGKPGGFRSIEETPELAGIQCESCHGPHSKVLAVMTLQNKNYKRSEVLAAGLVVPNEATCVGQCHNPNSPFITPDYKFDYPSRKNQGTHEHAPLRFQHG